jgi:hypothetical protein
MDLSEDFPDYFNTVHYRKYVLIWTIKYIQLLIQYLTFYTLVLEYKQ